MKLFTLRHWLSRAAVLTVLVLPAPAQFHPESAHVILNFPQLADGGTPAQQWQTTFVFMNTNSWLATCQLEIRDGNGRPLPLDLGQGSSATHRFTIAPDGSHQLRSQVASSTIVVGWAQAICTAPVQGTVLFRAIEGGTLRVEISAAAVVPAGGFASVANADLGIAIANPVFADRTLEIEVIAVDAAGRTIGSRTIPLCGLCHTAANLGTLIPGLGPGFQGSVRISSQRPSDVFIAWTLNADRGLLSSLPNGALSWPISHLDRILLVYRKLFNAATSAFPQIDFSRMRLVTSSEPVINAFARADGLIQINIALAELISDSPSELAAVIGHEIGHYIQYRTGQPHLFYQNAELDADSWGAFLSMAAGYDPYGGAGVFGKLMMASRRTGLLHQQFDNLLDPHTSFSNRMGVLLDTLTTVCAHPSARLFCQQYKELVHPTLPPDLPLSLPPSVEAQ